MLDVNATNGLLARGGELDGDRMADDADDEEEEGDEDEDDDEQDGDEGSGDMERVESVEERDEEDDDDDEDEDDDKHKLSSSLIKMPLLFLFPARFCCLGLPSLE